MVSCLWEGGREGVRTRTVKGIISGRKRGCRLRGDVAESDSGGGDVLGCSRSFGGFSDIGALKGRCPLDDDEDVGEFTTDTVSDCRQRLAEVLLSHFKISPPPCRSIPHSISLMTANKQGSDSAKCR